jgi:hypothetical protein
LKDVLRGFLVAFPDMHWSVEEQIEEVTSSSADLFGAAPIERNSWALPRPDAQCPSGGSQSTASLMEKSRTLESSWMRLD